jgi:uridine monophosphate synthetase
MSSPTLSYAARAAFCQNTLAKQLLQLMQDKESNLALSADVLNSENLLALADEMGPEICVLKTHVDILNDFSHKMIEKLVGLAKQHQFMIFEDRKFADIGNTVKHQYEGGVYRIAEWAHLVNAHSLPGPGIIQGLAEVGLNQGRGLLMLAEMSSQGNLLDAAYAQKTLAMAEQFPEFVIGFIAQHKLNDDPRWIYMTPGIKFSEGKDALGQQYNTPEMAIIEKGTDIIIVGRDIINAANPLEAAKKYRAAGWKAYLMKHGF